MVRRPTEPYLNEIDFLRIALSTDRPR